jgi:hypothetical protein
MIGGGCVMSRGGVGNAFVAATAVALAACRPGAATAALVARTAVNVKVNWANRADTI